MKLPKNKFLRIFISIFLFLIGIGLIIYPNRFDLSKTNTINEQKVASAQISPIPSLQEKQTKNLYKILKVIDGDTIMVSINGKKETLRLIGMDTPETVDPRKPVQCFGNEASIKAKLLLENKSVELGNDPTQGELDKYKRLLRYVYLPDGTFFNKFMIREGYAHEYTYNIPYKYQREFKLAEKEAREAKRGLWADNACYETLKPFVSPSPYKPVNENYSCENKSKCNQMSTCDEAYFYLQNCGLTRLDADKDGVPCESLCK